MNGSAAAIREELERAERLYEEGVAGIEYLPEDGQFAVVLAAVLYADHHRLVGTLGYDTVSTTPQLSASRELSLLVRTRWRRQPNRDPERAFYAVSTGFDDERRSRGLGPGDPAAVRTD